MVGMFKKKQQDKELLDGKIFSGELSEIGIKSQEEQNNVMKGFVKEKYCKDGSIYRLLLGTFGLTALISATLYTPMRLVAEKTPIPFPLLVVVGVFISFQIAIRIVATIETLGKGFVGEVFPNTPSDKLPKGIIYISDEDKTDLLNKFATYNVLGIRKNKDDTFSVLVAENGENIVYSADSPYISTLVSRYMVEGKWYSIVDFVYDKAKGVDK